LAPQGKWIVNFADAQCIASRNYGTAENPLYLILKAPALGDVLQVGILRKGATRSARQMNGEIAFDSHQSIATSMIESSVQQQGEMILMANLPRDQLASMRAASAMRVRARDADQGNIDRGSRIPELAAESADYEFKLAQIPALLDALGTCTADLKKVWNVEEDNGPLKLVQQRPSGSLRQAFTEDDYPMVAIRKDQGGSMQVAVLVDEKGKVADCTIIQTSGIASLDTQSCAIIKQRAQLKPAVGLDGKPAKGALLQKITWAIEED
jgi:TonB family protein